MASANRAEHFHKYMRVAWGKNKTIIYRCMLPGCKHYLHKELVRGRVSLCWQCLQPFVMNLDKMRRLKPKCDKCQKGPDPVMDRISKLLEEL